jgi:phosphate-selective porin OprO/OprP
MDGASSSNSNQSREGGRGINLERQRLGEDPGQSPSRGLPAGEVAGWSNGFYLQSRDQRFVFRITGQIQADYRGYIDDNDTTDIATFLVRRARFGLEATIFEYYEFRLLPDFGQGQSRIQDAYLNIHYWDGFQFEAGKFKQPFSYEQLIQDRYVPTMERSLFDQLVPARDAGVMIHGENLFCNRFDYAAAISNGQINGDFDVNNNKDFNARVALRPFRTLEEGSLVRFLELGMSGGFGEQHAPVQPATLFTPLQVEWFQYNPSVRAQGLRSRYSPEISYFYGPLGLAAQYYHQDQALVASVTGPGSRAQVEVPSNGFYVMTTLLLTGEERTGYSQAIAPRRAFDPRYPFANPGAWELVGRVSRLKLSDVVFNPGPMQLADPARFSSGATEMTLGFNWYFNRFVRMQFNWEHSWFDSPVQLGNGAAGLLGHQDAIGTRFQIIF